MLRSRVMLGGVGVGESEERIYRTLIRLGGATVAELAAATDADDLPLRSTLCTLEEKGLASRAPGPLERFVPAPPDVAVEALAARRSEEVARARLAATELMGQFRSGPGPDRAAEVLEVVTGTDAVRSRFEQLQRSAVEELLVFDKPPYTAGAGQRGHRARGPPARRALPRRLRPLVADRARASRGRSRSSPRRARTRACRPRSR